MPYNLNEQVCAGKMLVRKEHRRDFKAKTMKIFCRRRKFS
jgi:hypothetical protein